MSLPVPFHSFYPRAGHPRHSRRPTLFGLALFALLGALVVLPQASVAAVLAAPHRQQADFSGASPSAETRRVADWVVSSNDNHDLPFIIVDKIGAALFLFDGGGALRATNPVLLGLARGDDSPLGIGDRKLSMISRAERVTPAGRFVAAPGKNLRGQDILWVDYGAAVALHKATDVMPGLTARDRLARLASAAPGDKRITYGCVNVSPDFYDRYVRETFSRTTGIVYILPETRSASDVFHIPDQRAKIQASVDKPAGVPAAIHVRSGSKRA